MRRLEVIMTKLQCKIYHGENKGALDLDIMHTLYAKA